jgi:DNA-nicking Smr family endonuclease
MGRRQQRRRSSVAPTTTSNTAADMGISANIMKGNISGSNNPNSILPPASLGQRSPQDVQETIDYHWTNLSPDLKIFLLTNPSKLSLHKFVDYWSSPDHIHNTNQNIAASICGCSWYLALNYMFIRKVVEARALILNGCFLQQCYNKPIEEIVSTVRSNTNLSGENFKDSLPYFCDGLVAISTEERMMTFLCNKVTQDYQRRMSFATKTEAANKQVQNYVNQISSDWNESTSGQSYNRAAARRRATVIGLHVDDKFIDIKLIDAAVADSSSNKNVVQMRYGVSMTLKLLFKKYADDNDLNLRKLRFTYEGRTLFLSSLGQKSLSDLGINHLDCIYVHGITPSSDDERSDGESSAKENKSPGRQGGAGTSSPTSVAGRRKFRPANRRNSWTCPFLEDEEERKEQDKRKHSHNLTQLFEEAEPKFKAIRQKLALLSIECDQPKVKKGSLSSKRHKSPVAIQPINNPNMDGTGGKAGVPFHVVHVGEVQNLYKTGQALQGQRPISIDLHGHTQEEALTKLNESLPQWMETAMKGAYPFVIPVCIISGCGNQIISETVEQWIRQNDNVSNAPKKKFSRRRSI